MKILICHNAYLEIGGEDRTVFSEKNLLEKNGHFVFLFLRSNEEFFKGNIFLKIIEVFFSISTYKKISKIIKEFKPDIIHIHNTFLRISPSVYFAAKRYKVPVVQTLHNYRLLCLNGLFLLNNGKICEKCKNGNFLYGVINRCYRKSFIQSFVVALLMFTHTFLLKAFRKVDVFISPSEFLKEKVKETKRFRNSNIVVKPHFVKLSDKISDEFEDHCLYLGRLSREKGLFTLLKAFERIKNFKLFIAGAGYLKNFIEDFIKRKDLKNIFLLGYIKGEKKDEILSKSSFTVLPSECYENMPYSILESFSYGVPVITSKIGGLKELIIDGYNGFLFDPGNVDDLVSKIKKLIENKQLLLKMRKNARKVAEEKYSEEKGYENLMKIYNTLLKK